ncbi:hypothetical protein CRYUN_Cryun29cG0020500 [Craigia yunnanensis]
MEDFYYMAEDFVDDMDEDNYVAGGDMDADEYDMECKQMEKGGNYYEFFHITRLVKPTILNFQLRNLVWATSKHDVYLMSNYSVMHWSPLSCNLSEVLNFSEHVAPTEKHSVSLLEGFTQTQISTLAVKDNYMVVGGFQGELTFKTVATVVGHLDYSFASAWHPDGRIFAPGNQDKTCRVWDIRNLSKPVATLKGNLGAVRSIRFSSDGQFMVVAEPADFVHVYSTRADYHKRRDRLLW